MKEKDKLKIADILLKGINSNENIDLNMSLIAITLTRENKFIIKHSDYIRNNHKEIIDILLKNGYIERAGNTFNLTSKGKTARNLGGHFEYLKQNDKLTKFQKYTLIGTTIAITISAFSLFQSCENSKYEKRIKVLEKQLLKTK